MIEDTVKSRGERRTTKSNAHHLTQQELSLNENPVICVIVPYRPLSTLGNPYRGLSALKVLRGAYDR